MPPAPFPALLGSLSHPTSMQFRRRSFPGRTGPGPGPGLLVVLALLAGVAACGTDGSDPSATDETGTLVLGATGTFPPELTPTSWRGRITGGGIDLTLEGSTPGLTSPALPAGSYTVSLAGVADAGVVLFGQRQDVAVVPGAPMSLLLELGSYVPRPLPPGTPPVAGAPITLRWESVPGASGGYDVELGPDPSFTTSVDRSSTQEASFPVVFPTPGTWYFRVRGRANPRVSLPGAWSSVLAPTRLEVEAPPVVELSVARVELEARVGDGSAPGAVVEVRNGGGGDLGPLSVAVDHAPGEPGGWLQVTLQEGGDPPRLVLTPLPEGLPAGVYRATVEVEAGGGGAAVSTGVLEVEFTLRPRTGTASIGVDPETVTFLVGTGGGAPSPRLVTVTNLGEGILEGLAAGVSYPAGGAAGWLTASLDRTRAPATLSLAVNPAGLPEGEHQAVVAISGEGADNTPRLLPVTLTVAGAAAPPVIDLTSTAVAFSYLEGRDPPPPQVVRIRNGGGGVLSGLTTAVEYQAGEPTGWLQAALNSTTALATMTLTTTPGGLPVGDHTARVRVESPVSDGAGIVTVTLSVAPVPLATLTVVRVPPGGTGNVVLGAGDTLIVRGLGADSAQRVLPVGTEVTVAVADSLGWVAYLTADGRPDCQRVKVCTVVLDGDLRIRVPGTNFFDYGVIWELRGGGRISTPRPSSDLPFAGYWFGTTPAFRSHLALFGINTIMRSEVEADPGWRFQGWSGPCTGSDPVCEWMIGPVGIYFPIATFEPIPPSTWPRFDGPRRFEFTVPVGSSTVASQTQSFNGSDLSIHPVTRWQDSGGDWATVEMLETGASGEIQVTVNPSGLAAGTYERTVTFVSWKAEDTRMDVVVVLRVAP